jgi:hypothetical protein
LDSEPFPPEKLRAARAAARRGTLVEYVQLGEGSPWFAFVHGPRGTNVHAAGETIPAARRRARAELAAASGKKRAAELWGLRVETMPEGAEVERAPRGSRPSRLSETPRTPAWLASS